MTIPTTRLIIVCTAAARTLVNTTLDNVDPTSSGNVLVSGLTLPSSPATPIVGYWASWALDAATSTAVRNAVKNAGWSPKPTPAEQRVYEPGDTIPAWGSQRVWLFNGDTWTNPDDVLTTLGIQRRAPIDN
jgi:hypothetical protein